MPAPEVNTSRTADDSQRPLSGATAPYLFRVFECDRLVALPARACLHGVGTVTIGRRSIRGAELRDGRLSIFGPDPFLSSVHTRIRRTKDGWLLEDNGSKNGTLVGGVRVRRRLLEDGDLFEAGHTFFLFRASLPRPESASAWVEASELPSETGLLTLQPQLEAAFAQLRAVSPSKLPLLIAGETGTGKELAASAAHALSGRAGPLKAVNCAAIEPALLEAKLFGHARGAFPGAVDDEAGLLRASDGGTLFLDEIGELPLPTQATLLRALQQSEVTPVGASQAVNSIKRRARFALGKWNGGCRPYGYTSEAADLKPHPEEAPVLRQIFEMYLAHPSFASVRNRLKGLGIPDRRGKVWSAKALEWIMRNPLYAGDVHERGEVRLGVHEALVPREMWEAAQRTLPTRTRLVEAKKYKRIYPLRGLIFCGHCRVAMKAHRATGRGGRLYPRYRCEQTFSRAWADCPVKEIRAEAIEEWVAQQLTKITADATLLESVIAAANATASEAAKPLVERRVEVEARLAEVRAKEANLANAIASGGSFEALKAALASEQANRHQLDTQQDALKRQIETLAGDPLDPVKVRKLLSDFRLLYEVATDEERADLLRLLFARIDFHGKNGNVVVTFREDVKLNLPVRSYGVNWLLDLGSNQGPTD